MIVKYNEQMSHNGAKVLLPKTDILSQWVSLKAPINDEDMFGTNYPACIVTLYVDNACIVNQVRSSDAHLEMNVRLFSFYSGVKLSQ